MMCSKLGDVSMNGLGGVRLDACACISEKRHFYLTSCWAWLMQWHYKFVWFSDLHMHTKFHVNTRNYMATMNSSEICSTENDVWGRYRAPGS